MCPKKLKLKKILYSKILKNPSIFDIISPSVIFYLDIRIKAISYHMNRATGPIIITSGRRIGTPNLIFEYLST